MKKLVLILFTTLLFNNALQAQVATYVFARTTSNYVPITSGTVLATGATDDLSLSARNIGFTFKFNGVNYTTFGLNSNGWICMGSQAPTNTYLPISAAFSNSSTNVIAALAANLQLGYSATGQYTAGSKTISSISTDGYFAGDILVNATGFPAGTKVVQKSFTTLVVDKAATSSGSGGIYTVDGTIRSTVLGVAPNRVCVIEWAKARQSGVIGRKDYFNFQIRLHETSNMVKISYGAFQTNSNAYSNYQVGLRGNSSSDFNNRKTTTNWVATTPGNLSTSFCSLFGTVRPASDLNFTWTPATSSCTGTPSAGTISGTSSTCPSQSIDLTLTGYTPEVLGTTLQWQKSSSLTGGTYTSIAGGTYPTLSIAQSADTYYRCRVKCTSSGISSYSPVKNVTMSLPSNCYCTLESADCSDYGISGISFGGINSTSQCSQNGYSYKSTPNPTFNRGINYPFRVRSLDPINGQAGAWIDYNRNGSFEGSEFINPKEIRIDNENEDHFANVLIPSTASLGQTRMRVRITSDSYTLSPYSECHPFAWGETEDYLITIGNPSNCSGTPTSGTVVTSVDAQNGTGSATWWLNLTLVNYPTTAGITFQWQKSTTLNGVYTDITNGTKPSFNTHIASGNNFYRCKVTCSSSGQFVYSAGKKVIGTTLLREEGAANLVEVSTPSAIDEFASLAIYPNPSVDGLVTISIEEASFSSLSIEIIDLQGKQVYISTDNINASNYSKQINVGKLAKGIYYVKLSTENTIKTEKLIVQ